MTQLTTKTAKRLEEIMKKLEHPIILTNNQKALFDGQVISIISMKDELKEIIKKHLPVPRLHDDLWDNINKLIQEIEQVQNGM